MTAVHFGVTIPQIKRTWVAAPDRPYIRSSVTSPRAVFSADFDMGIGIVFSGTVGPRSCDQPGQEGLHARHSRKLSAHSKP